MEDLYLPARRGARPRTTTGSPHEQLDDIAPAALQERLWARMASLPGVVTGHSHIAPAGSRALSLAAAPDRRKAFMIGREFAHLHPAHDGSLHLTLDPAMFRVAVDTGWAEPHPLAGRFAPATTAMIYGPRDEHELDVVMLLVERSLRYARGELGA